MTNAEDVAGAPWWWRSTEDGEDDIDDDWDWDTELGRLDPGPDGPVRHPWVPPVPSTEPPRVRDDRVAVVGGDDVGEFVRACRAAAGFSQRELAAAAGVTQSTVARIEAGGGAGRLATLCRLAGACGVELVGAVGPARDLLTGDLGQRHRDDVGRLFPAHLENRPLAPWHGAWWGDDRYTHRRARPVRTYGRRPRGGPSGSGSGSGSAPSSPSPSSD